MALSARRDTGDLDGNPLLTGEIRRDRFNDSNCLLQHLLGAVASENKSAARNAGHFAVPGLPIGSFLRQQRSSPSAFT